ncbi:DKNYY domain-containing protein [Chryseobacterium nepalense]|uniref:DKNYY domain-containing protein n=1 Tax=Chryseobacterium nepalense TaxID=1854498 RepID=A0ABY4K2U1_9FLAO|nr:DKNYY domain-containing protein [Chryseobacterium nepalense]UPQ74681.1 DKNYY domain-containing protein [Chryseobacterium nepalense]
MENPKKVVFYFVLLILIFSCKGQEKNDFILKRNDDIFIKVPFLLGERRGENFFVENDTIFFKTVKINGIETEIKNSIDIESFALIPINIKEKKEINNPYYLSNPFYNYFIDRNHIYIYRDDLPTPQFFQIGKAKEYKILGGAYLKINNKIYWRGIEVLNADINSFKVVNVQRNKSEWQASIGMDKKHIYSGDKVMRYEEFSKHYFLNKQILSWCKLHDCNIK